MIAPDPTPVDPVDPGTGGDRAAPGPSASARLSPQLPAKRPCGSCPYRTDAPSGLWDAGEYAKLPPYDRPTPDQPALLFLCHQVDGHICAGWAGCHDMNESLAVRIAAIDGDLSPQDVAALRSYTTDIDLFPTGRAVAEHGLVDVGDPSPEAVRAARKLAARRERLRPS